MLSWHSKKKRERRKWEEEERKQRRKRESGYIFECIQSEGSEEESQTDEDYEVEIPLYYKNQMSQSNSGMSTSDNKNFK